jgi:hypothetical protein
MRTEANNLNYHENNDNAHIAKFPSLRMLDKPLWHHLRVFLIPLTGWIFNWLHFAFQWVLRF